VRKGERREKNNFIKQYHEQIAEVGGALPKRT
jgi:hypothetical protein